MSCRQKRKSSSSSDSTNSKSVNDKKNNPNNHHNNVDQVSNSVPDASNNDAPISPINALFEKSKLVVYIDPFHPQNPGIMIYSAQQQFRNVFLYPPIFDPFSFDVLIGSLTCPAAIRRMNNAILIGRSHLDNVTLYKKDKRPLACHIAIQSITGNPTGADLSPTPDYPRTYRWAVITIRSAKILELVKEQLNTTGTVPSVAESSL